MTLEAKRRTIPTSSPNSFRENTLMPYTHSLFRRRVTHVAVSILVIAAACKGRTVNVASGTLDTVALRTFKKFTIMAPTPRADSVAVVAADSNRVAGTVMQMDPMLSTSIVGRAIRQD